MRCLGRLFVAFLLIVTLAAGWLYRDNLLRWGRDRLDPRAAARRVGHPSPAAYRSALTKVDSLQRFRPDSIVLTADEMASLVATGATFLPENPFDSLTIELGQRSIRVRTMVNTAKLPERVRTMSPVTPAPFEEVIGSGTLTPVRDGKAELHLESVQVRGIPVPADVVSRVIAGAVGTANEGRLELTMPAGMRGFRIRPEGVAIYRSGDRP